MKMLLAAALLLAWSLPCVAGELQAFKHGRWQILRQSHAGKPMVVHFWGLTCGPCLSELPDWGKLAQERPNSNLVLIAADPSPVQPAAISATLAKDGLSDTDNWVFDGFSERLRYEVDPHWQGELPRTLLIGADGSVTAVDGVADLAVVRAWLDAREHVK